MFPENIESHPVKIYEVRAGKKKVNLVLLFVMWQQTIFNWVIIDPCLTLPCQRERVKIKADA